MKMASLCVVVYTANNSDITAAGSGTIDSADTMQQQQQK